LIDFTQNIKRASVTTCRLNRRRGYPGERFCSLGAEALLRRSGETCSLSVQANILVAFTLLEHFLCYRGSRKGRSVAFPLGKTPIDLDALDYTHRENALS
jgi:hypothetical protein